VGVGSVGTRCYLSLLADPDLRSPLFLQLKEAREAVLAHTPDRPGSLTKGSEWWWASG
jgi:Uncharacterized protein conserved in bacteria (DUF2252)